MEYRAAESPTTHRAWAPGGTWLACRGNVPLSVYDVNQFWSLNIDPRSLFPMLSYSRVCFKWTDSRPDEEDHGTDEDGGEQWKVVERVSYQSRHVFVEAQVVGEVETDSTAHI